MFLLLPLWFACFASFAWATRAHFRNRGFHTGGMRWTFGLGSLFAVLQGAAVALRPGSSIAAGCYVCSLALFWWTIRTTRGKGLGACFASIESHELVTGGPYRWIRHPFYTSYLLSWIAGAFLYPPLAIPAFVMGFIYRRAAIEEETRFLRGPNGAAYREYCRRTGRFF